MLYELKIELVSFFGCCASSVYESNNNNDVIFGASLIALVVYTTTLYIKIDMNCIYSSFLTSFTRYSVLFEVFSKNMIS